MVVDKRIKVVEHVITLIDRILTQLSDRTYKAQTMSNSIFASYLGIIIEPERIINNHSEAA